MEYDENGNLVRVNNGCGTTTYTWDARNRLVGIRGFDKDCNPLSASFKYDALGRRIERTINGKTIQYLYDGLDIIQEIENGQVTVNYIRTFNIDEPLARIKVDGTVRYYQQDALGSVIALTDETGTIRTQYSYDPYGNTTISGEPSDNPFQYTGRENDNTGLYYYRARYYSPELQRFISEDPIRLLGGINSYAYASNNPLRYIDPRGTSECESNLAKCGKRAVENDLECLRNALKGYLMCAMSCPIGCIAAGPAYAECVAICEASCGAALAATQTYCHVIELAELTNCWIEYYKCKRDKKDDKKKCP